MTPFHVGMKVVCVDDEWDPNCTQSLFGIPFPMKKGSVYEVCEIRYQTGWYKGHLLSGICLVLQGIKYPSTSRSTNSGFSCERFRPAYENRMDELRSLLITPSVPADKIQVRT